jgi:tRNA-Thr(GGU) m(6)t(6)A37 methyltransferase TsaA
MDRLDSLVLCPIGIVHTPFVDRVSTPRQPRACQGAPGTVELFSGRGLEFAVEDLASWPYVWLLFWFHLNRGWRPKVLPPRSTRRRGVLATRSPHRPNPIGLSVVELVRVDGLTLDVRGVDLVDGTPLLDIKPYVAYTDAISDTRTGWLADDPVTKHEIAFSDVALRQLAWLRDRGVELRSTLVTVLEAGARPHPYRRIRRDANGFRLALHDWRAHFTVDGHAVLVERIASGYRRSQLVGDPRTELNVHRDFERTFG